MSSTQKQIATTQIEYDWIPDVEDLDGYAPGGFHPVKVGEIYDERYQIVDKVGFGGYSTVWLARDIVRRRYVALKAGMAGRHSKHEIGILQALHASRSPEAGRSYIPELFSHFQVEGPNGITPFYAMTPASATLQGTRFPGMCGLTVSRALCKELAMAILFIHSAGYVHGGKCEMHRMYRPSFSVPSSSIALLNGLFRSPSQQRPCRTAPKLP